MEQIYVRDVTRATVRLNASSCWNCGVIYGTTEEFDEARKSDGGTMYCPNGHSAAYTTTTKQLLKAERETTARLRAELDQTVAEVAEKGKEIRRMKRRAGAGMCSVCRRHFANVERHMKGQHPEACS